MSIRRIFVLDNPVQEYAWGSKNAIPDLLGETGPRDRPVAELWMGAHPKAPSRVGLGDRWLPLHELVAQAPEEILGTRAAERFSGKFPFLFKVLAAEKPLSIQVHPDLDLARKGFERENREGIPLDAPQRNYKDPGHKPELVCALGPFEALKGFRKLEEIHELLRRACPATLAEDLRRFRAHMHEKGLSQLFRRILSLDGREKEGVLAEALRTARALAGTEPAFEWVTVLERHYPGDRGILAPLFLNLIRLEPGHALYLPAGELHSYLRGIAVELMANSDNVLRGGLTAKHVDPDELLRLVRFEPSPAQWITPRSVGPAEAVFDTPAEEFELSVISTHTHWQRGGAAGKGPEILLCVSGEGLALDPDTGQEVGLRRGVSLLIPGSVRSYEIRGKVRLFRAHLP
ncbi:MAG: mannose-6-phosphate isomerase, class I [Deltaproteobacteria bacterium]|nr:mannose-6-phosphate isomerase, class I [Deltaproteobacteria bacterium]MBW1921982.1 mannose-6-phosphate isomerase, class I [Deltaproteobacteria bacterium]MBW1948749.1 mannose-6-phosphate isomerase, class I [Deltaproteobacteria bacterium]MBW2006427.1 mannose-6-phosphate isomerase, class I [Deltaproteobacteria bacterium]MBW2346350.1 mannose-6-phosphate isomerase, class I [Deltaproteobacteria bacterium]